MTMNELMQYYIGILSETKSVRPVTIDGYQKHKKDADKFIGDRLINELTFLDIEDFCRDPKKREHHISGTSPETRFALRHTSCISKMLP
jgi:hypothetical protein